MRVEIKNLTKKYGIKTALQEIDLIVPPGMITVILGPSGSGKTTLLRLIAGLLPATSGEILFNDENVSDKPANKRNVAMVFQNYPLFPHMTIEDNMKFALESKKRGKLFRTNFYSKEDIQKKVNETLNLLHIEEHRYKYPSQLSGGEKQRVAIGRELVRDPDLFLFDEPLSNIDARLRYEMRMWIRKLHELISKTMIYVTHDQSEAMALADFIVLLDEGEIVQIGKPEELYYEPKSMFVAKFIGNYPMNFLEFNVKKSCNLVIDKDIKLPNKISEKIMETKLTSGNIGFRAENVLEFDKNKSVDKESLKLDCKIEDIEKVLDQQVLTLNFKGEHIFYVTKTRKNFTKNESISVIIQSDDIYLFDAQNNRF